VDGTGIQIDNMVDLRANNNQELAMRLDTALESGDSFYTDLNGFQMIRRKRLAKLPLQANFYPMPSMVYLQDESNRLTLVSRQPLGTSSLASGQVEVMLDRRLMQDDNRGLFQGVTDNQVTPNSFFLLLERKLKGCQDEAEDPAASYPSLLALSARQALMFPLFRLIWAGPSAAAVTLSKNYEPVDKDLACDIHVITLRTMQESAFKQEPSNEAALIVHRQGFNGCYKPVGLTCSTNGGKVRNGELRRKSDKKLGLNAIFPISDKHGRAVSRVVRLGSSSNELVLTLRRHEDGKGLHSLTQAHGNLLLPPQTLVRSLKLHKHTHTLCDLSFAITLFSLSYIIYVDTRTQCICDMITCKRLLLA